MLCRYCLTDKKMTKEHIISAFIYEYLKSVPLPVYGWNERAKKILGAEATTADVCKECNGGPLSSLDAYGKKFLETNGFLTKIYLKESTLLKFDYHMLLRWLMKISYNSLAAAKDPSCSAYEDYREYILTGKDAPTEKEIMLFVGLASPAKVKEIPDNECKTIINEDKLIAPFVFRIHEVNKGFVSAGVIMNGITIGSLFFHIALLKNAKISRSLFKRTSCDVANIKYVSPKSSEMMVSSCGLTWYERMGKQKMREHLSIDYEATLTRISKKR